MHDKALRRPRAVAIAAPAPRLDPIFGLAATLIALLAAFVLR